MTGDTATEVNAAIVIVMVVTGTWEVRRPGGKADLALVAICVGLGVLVAMMVDTFVPLLVSP